MPKAIVKAPDTIRPFEFHGVPLDWEGREHAQGECPFCGKEKLTVTVETGLWGCFVCGEKGNVTVFLRRLWEESFKNTNGGSNELAEDRGYLDPYTTIAWGCAKSFLTGDWLIPGFTLDGRLMQLYRWKTGPDGKRILYPTPGDIGHWLHMPTPFDPSKPDLVVCEGPWDGMALWEVLRHSKQSNDPNGGFEATSSETSSVLASMNVVAIPGCGSVGEPLKRWLKLFPDKRVLLPFDSDLPIHKGQIDYENGKSAGFEAVKRAVHIIASDTADFAGQPPKELSYIHWGDKGYDPLLKHGYDVRDFFTQAADAPGRAQLLSGFLGKVRLCPESWQGEKAKAGSAGKGAVLEPTPCRSWRELRNEWTKALKWPDKPNVGVDAALPVMLATALSTEQVGDQIFLQVIGEAGCLHRDTPIHDPVDGTTKTVFERFKLGKRFSVWSLLEDGSAGMKVAMPPCQYQEEDIYRVTFKSGREIKVTAGHRFWDGSKYVTLRAVMDALPECGAFRLPSISEPGLLARKLSMGEPSYILYEDDAIVNVKKYGRDVYYDFHVPGTLNYWAAGVFNHNSAKTRLCDGMLVSQNCYGLEHLTGFHSGWKSGSEDEDYSLIARINRKTLITPEGDVLMSSPHFTEIMSQQRRIFDGTSKQDYKTLKEQRVHGGLRTPWIIAGTPALLSADQSRLGDRFIRIYMDPPGSAERQEILRHVGYAALRAMPIRSNCKASSILSEEMAAAYCATGGYVDFLRANASELLSKIEMDEEALVERCALLAEFAADFRARPDPNWRKDEKHEAKEMPTRLTYQFVRLACCIAVVMDPDKPIVSADVLARVRKVAIDTGRGRSLEIAQGMLEYRDHGMNMGEFAIHIGEAESRISNYVHFMRKIGLAESYFPEENGITQPVRWRLTKRAQYLCKEVL